LAKFSVLFFGHNVSELRQPIAAKFCHRIKNWLDFIVQVQKFGGRGLFVKKSGDKTCKMWPDVGQLWNLKTEKRHG